MKKQILLLAMMLLPLVASAEPVEIDGIYYNLVSKIKEAEVTNRLGENHVGGSYSGSVNIPTSITCDGLEYSVTSIGNYAFYYCSSLTSITIPNSVTSIGDCAFWECSGLTSVTIPNSVTSIGGGAFWGCSSLTSITIPNSITIIRSSAFYGCSGLTSVTIPNSVIYIGGAAFEWCGLTSVTIPNSVEKIGGFAFYGCSGLTSVTIPNSVTSIEDKAFYLCYRLTSVTIGSGVKNIKYQAFASCKKLTDVYCLAENVPSTETDAFQDSNIEYATLHVPAASINDYKTKEPWKNFKNIIGLDGTIIELPKCATPTISHFISGWWQWLDHCSCSLPSWHSR